MFLLRFQYSINLNRTIYRSLKRNQRDKALRLPISLEMPDLSIYSSPYYTKGRVKYSSNEFSYFSFTKKGRIIIYFPKRERRNNIFVSLSTTEDFQLRVSFSRSILRARNPAYRTSSSQHSSRTKDSLSLGSGEIHGRGYLQGVFSRLAWKQETPGFVCRWISTDFVPRRANLPQPTFVRTDITLPSTSVTLQDLPPLITIKNVVLHRLVEERLSTSLTGLYNGFRNIIIRADVDEINSTSAPPAKI